MKYKLGIENLGEVVKAINDWLFTDRIFVSHAPFQSRDMAQLCDLDPFMPMPRRAKVYDARADYCSKEDWWNIRAEIRDEYGKNYTGMETGCVVAINRRTLTVTDGNNFCRVTFLKK